MINCIFKLPHVASFAVGYAVSSFVWLAYSQSRGRLASTQVGGEAGAQTIEEERVLMVEQRPRIILFGDSLTQQGFSTTTNGWAAQIADLYQRRSDVLNRGFSGYNSRWARLLLPELFPAEDPAPLLVAVLLGANDAALPGYPQHVPVAEYEENLRAIVAHFRTAYPGTGLLLLTPPPVHEGLWGAFVAAQGRELDRRAQVTAQYAAACRRVARREGLPLVDCHAAMGGEDQGAAAPFLSDGLHLTARGNDKVFQMLDEVLRREFKHIYPEEGPLEMQAPWWGDVDPRNPARSLLPALARYRKRGGRRGPGGAGGAKM
mmetsp:Transcript_39266/g.57783  ORF Transcript_39266/g.57783 Transcript_39266/m.57783 type:complete len:318 (+) Transcript_39266:98-1051(+)